MASSSKANVKVNLWVTTDGRNRSVWFKRLRFCKSNPCMLPPPPLWLRSQIMNISWRASDTVPRNIFQGCFFFSLIETLGLESVTETWSQSVAPEAKDRIYDAPVDDIRWIFSFLTRELLCPPQLINHWAVLSFCCHSLKDLFCLRHPVEWRNDFSLPRVQTVFWQTAAGSSVWSVWSWNN